MRQLIVGMPPSTNKHSKELISFFTKCFNKNTFTIKHIEQGEGDSLLSNNNIDILISIYKTEIERPLTDLRFLFTTLPKADSLFTKDKFVIVFLRSRIDLVKLFSSYFGKVWFVGAGAGNRELITVKGKNILQKADVVISDYLLDQQILKYYVNKEAELIPLTKFGERIHKNQVSQEMINEAILRYACIFNKVVRLKGGDSFVFGRGGEECEYILPYNILYEVIPGISAHVSALCYAGIPLTHREYNAGFLVITGFRKKGEDIDKSNNDIANKINFGLKSKLLVALFMSMTNWRNFAHLIYDQDSPAAVIESGAYANQRIFTTTIKNVNNIISAKGLKSPTLIVLGENVKTRQWLKWYEKLPLYGVKVLTFSSDKLSYELNDALNSLGVHSISHELYDLIPEDLSLVESYFRALSDYDYLIVTSRNAFDIFLSNLKVLNIDIRSLPKIIVTGRKTEQEFRKIGIYPDVIPKVFSSDGIIDELSNIDITGKRFLLPMSSLTKGNISKYILSQKGIVHSFVLYKNKAKPINSSIAKDIKDFSPNFIIFTSSSSVNYFVEHIYKADMSFIAVSMGSKTSNTLKSHGFMDILEPSSFTINGIISVLKNHIHKNKLTENPN